MCHAAFSRSQESIFSTTQICISAAGDKAFLRLGYPFTLTLPIDDPETVQLARELARTKLHRSHDPLKELWDRIPLEKKHLFVQILNQSEGEEFHKARYFLANIVYRRINSQHMLYSVVDWLSDQEIEKKGSKVAHAALKHAFYFYATSEPSLASVLDKRAVEVKESCGAFVSTQPDISLGKCIIAFRRNIERLSPLKHGFTMDHRIYWAGFSQNIPVTQETVACVILDEATLDRRKDIVAKCREVLGAEIPVIPLNDISRTPGAISEATSMGIPEEWPEDGPALARKIFQRLKG